MQIIFVGGNLCMVNCPLISISRVAYIIHYVLGMLLVDACISLQTDFI